ncbi:MAG: elongation factor 1-beta [Candidatus Woesearchaeota archaeon]
MGEMIITYKVMPKSPEIDLDGIVDDVDKILSDYDSEVSKNEKKPMAFGLNALMIYFILDEEVGNTEDIEEKINDLEGVQSVKVAEMRRR